MADGKKEEDNINSLCQKYFTPQLCAVPVTESKRSLEMKLFKQMQMYGNTMASKYQKLTFEDKEEAIFGAINDCWIMWKKNSPANGKFTGYYSITLKHRLDNSNIFQGDKNTIEVSIDKEDDNGNHFEDCLADDTENHKHPELEAVVEQLDEIEVFFQKWCNGEEKKGAHKKDSNTISCLSALLTHEMREDFLKWGKILKLEYGRSYSFLNKQILNMNQKINKEKIGALYGLKKDRVSHILSDFLNELKNQEL